MEARLKELNKRLDKLEKQNNQEILTIVEILSNATFFGEMKRANCEYAKNGQCSFFTLKTEAKDKIPIATKCRIRDCTVPAPHCHIEPSNITCALCQRKIKGMQ
jgi:seryl-tRNA synthetase